MSLNTAPYGPGKNCVNKMSNNDPVSKFRTFEAFKNPSFRLYYSGMAGQWMAMSMQQVVQSFLVYELTGSAAILGTMALVTALPQLIMTLFGGAFADRFQKKRMLQLGQAAAMMISVIIVVALATGYMSKEHTGSWWVLMVTSAITGIFNGLAVPARQAMIPELVEPERIMNAVSLNSVGQNAFSLIGPAIAGFLIDAVGFEIVYIIMIALYLVAVAFTNYLPSVKSISSGRNPLLDIKDGFRYLKTNNIILTVIVFNLLCVFLAGPRVQLMPIFAKDILKVGATGQGVIQSFTSVGSIIAALTYATLAPRNRGKYMLYAAVGLGLGIIVFALNRSYIWAIGLAVIMGMGQSGHMTMGTIITQSMTDKAYLGRVFSVLTMSQSIGSFGTFFVGIMAQGMGAPLALSIFGIVLFLMALAVTVFMPHVRRIN